VKKREIAAFPNPFMSDAIGMTLRDYFAAHAMAAMTAAPDYSKGHCNHAIAERAFLIADHMMTERETAEKESSNV
jgi:hypothetical protein